MVVIFSNQQKYYYNISEDSAIAPNKKLLNLLFVVQGRQPVLNNCVCERKLCVRAASRYMSVYIYLGAGGVGYSLD